MGSTWGLLSLFRGDNHVPSSVYPVCLHPLFYPYQLSELLPHQPWGWWFLHLYNPWPWWCHPRPSGCLPPSSKNPSICPPSNLLLPCSSPPCLPCSSSILPRSSSCSSWSCNQLW